MNIIVKLNAFLVMTGFTFMAQLKAADYALVVDKKIENKLYVYDYYLINNTTTDVRVVQFGSDCNGNWSIPRKQMQDVSLVNDLPHKNWHLVTSDSEEFSSPNQSINLTRADDVVPLNKGEKKIFTAKSKSNGDNFFLRQPYCLLIEGDTFNGSTIEREWQVSDQKIDLGKEQDLCQSTAQPEAYDTLKFNKESGVCSNAQIDFKSHTAELKKLCINQVLLNNRLSNIDLSRTLQSLQLKLNDNPSDKKLQKELSKEKLDLTNLLKGQIEALKSEVSGLTLNQKSSFDLMKILCEGSTTPIIVDVKPGKCDDKISERSNDDVRVSILGSKDFDVKQIDLTKVFLNGIKPEKIKLQDIGSLYNCADKTDGFVDVVMIFKTRELTKSLGELNDGGTYQVVIQATPLKGKPGDTFVGYSDLVLNAKKRHDEKNCKDKSHHHERDHRN